jgi:hypothetical protein
MNDVFGQIHSDFTAPIVNDACGHSRTANGLRPVYTPVFPDRLIKAVSGVLRERLSRSLNQLESELIKEQTELS